MATAASISGPSRLPSSTSSAANDYLDASATARRKQSQAGSNNTGKLFEDILLQCEESRITQPQQSNLVKNITADLTSDECQWDNQDRLSAIKVLKELSRLPASSEALATLETLQNVVSLTNRECTQVSASHIEASKTHDTTSTSIQGLDLLLRVLNNVLLQHSQSRQIFASSDLGGTKLALDLVEKSDSATIVFLAARLIFFSTLYEADITKEAVESWSLVEIFSRRTEELVRGPNTASVDMALAELQKAFFNVGLYYPRLVKHTPQGKAIVGESFHEALLPFLSPTLQLVNTHPSRSPTSLAPPITNAIAVLLNYPVAPYQSIWSTTVNDESTSMSRTSSTSKAKRMASSIFGRSSPTTSPPSVNKATFKSNSFLSILVDLLDEFLQRYFTTLDPDDAEAGKLAQSDGVDLQDVSEPALLLCRRLVDEVVDFRYIVKCRILPSDIDRSQGLDKRKDLTGILVRLMSSSVYPRLSRASGEVLLALCDGQSAKMTAEIGYGPCAGFLSQIGQLDSLPFAPVSDTAGQMIDPITGRVLPSAEEMVREDEAAGFSMTEEEKEAEAERLFGLFDRMDRNGVIKVQNPFKQAVDSGRIREIEEKEEIEEKKRIQEEDDEVESTVEREMKAFRLQQKRMLEDKRST